ncbi:MAG: hypothetical protein ABII03_04420 [Nanoarchaeota archaeon]
MKLRNREVARHAGVDYDNDGFRDLLDGESREGRERIILIGRSS